MLFSHQPRYEAPDLYRQIKIQRQQDKIIPLQEKGLKPKEIAELLGIDERTAFRRIARLRLEGRIEIPMNITPPTRARDTQQGNNVNNYMHNGINPDTQTSELELYSGLPLILASDVGVRMTGYAVMQGTTPLRTGSIYLRGRDVPFQDRIDHLTSSLDIICDQRSINYYVASEPSGLNWEPPSLRALEASLRSWSKKKTDREI